MTRTHIGTQTLALSRAQIHAGITRACVAILVIGVVCAHATAQPEQPINDDRLSEMLATQIEQSEQRTRALKDAKQMLDDGAPRREIIEMLQKSGVRTPIDHTNQTGQSSQPGARERRASMDAQLRGGPPWQDRRGDRREGQSSPDRPSQRMQIEWNDATRKAFVGEHFPEWQDRLATLREKNPELAKRLTMRIDTNLRRLNATYTHDPEMGALDIEEHRIGLRLLGIAGQIRADIANGATDEQLGAYRAELRERIGHAFDLRLERSRMQIARFEHRIERMQADLDRLISDRDSIIERQIDNMIEETRKRGKPGSGREMFDPAAFGLLDRPERDMRPERGRDDAPSAQPKRRRGGG